MGLTPAINSWLSLFFSVLMFRPLCDHIVYALYKVDVLHIGLNEFSADRLTLSRSILGASVETSTADNH